MDEVKIDQSFVRDMTISERDACIVRAVIDLGHNLGLRVVAEGVEDRVSLDLLASWGCDVAQGYFISHPLPAVDFRDWISAPTNGTVFQPARQRDIPEAGCLVLDRRLKWPRTPRRTAHESLSKAATRTD